MLKQKNIFKSGTILIVLLLFFSSASKAQPFRPFPDSSAVWTIGIYDVFGTYYSSYTYRISSNNMDTSISVNNYKKVFYFDGTGVQLYKGAVRQTAGRKVYFMPKDSVNEKLLYDFSANIGDTVYNVYSDWTGSEPAHNEAILDVDSVLLNGAYHKRLQVQLGFYWIEGIGSTGGLFESTYGGTFSVVYKLECFAKYDTTNFPDSGPDCLLMGIADMNADEGLSVFPNPSSGNFQLQLNLITPQKFNFKLYNSLGACIEQREICSSVSFNKSDLPEGIYFYELGNGMISKKGKLVVVR
jgi:hypothetical protein